MKKSILLLIVILCALTMLGLAQNTGDKDITTNHKSVEPDGAEGIVGPVATIFELDTSVSVDSFGRAGSRRAIGSGLKITAKENVLYEHQDYISVGGAVMPISPETCQIVDEITPVPGLADHGNSSVQCGPCRINFHHATEGVSLNGWFTLITIIGCQPSCYYAYTDYDVHGFMNNGAAWHPGEGVEPDALGQFVVRNNLIDPNVHYLYSALPTIASIDPTTQATHFMQGEYPTVREFIGSSTSCRNLPDAPVMFPNGDWSSALQYEFTRIGTEDNPLIVRYAHRRDDAVPFP